jgi:CRISPR/Cas system-associated exonuclease Cas4 (RecB family)
MAKYKHIYIDHTPPEGPESPHLKFGVMAHEVLYKAGCLRDEIRDGVIDNEMYYNVIPSELLYQDLKNEFAINSWQKYFTPIIKQVEEYENELINDMLCFDTDVQVEREIKLQLTADELTNLGYGLMNTPLVGVIDCLMVGKTYAVILDYKFSSNRKGQDEFDMNSQLPLYALLVHIKYDIPLHNIKVGYIDIPKQMFGKPTILTNGTLSRAKSQNVSQELYERAVKAVHGDDDPYYNCEPGGYYYDCWCNMAHNKCAYLTCQFLDMEAYAGITKDLLDAAKMIEFMKDKNLPFLKKYDSYSCKSCEYLHACKPWLSVGGFKDV